MAVASQPRKFTNAQEFVIGFLAIAPLTLGELNDNLVNFERSYIYKTLMSLVDDGMVVALPPDPSRRRTLYALSPKAIEYEQQLQARSNAFLVNFARLIENLRKSTLH